MQGHILVAEDDQRQAELIRRYLTAAGHRATVVHDGASAVEVARRQRPDLVVLDVMLPGLDGLEVCRQLRRGSSLPVLMLTARVEAEDLLLGLEVGADDYLRKPYDPRELMARIRTLLRRSQWTPATPDTARRVGELDVDVPRHHVAVAGRRIDCTPGEFEILAAMAAQPDRVFTRVQLLEHTRGFESCSTDRTVDMHIMNLRRKIEADPRRPRYLLTVYGLGYRLADGSR